jgi:predicted DNA-binding transcriptional regulator YafY
VAVEGGHVSAYDQLRGAVRTFAVHRITGVSVVEDESAS